MPARAYTVRIFGGVAALERATVTPPAGHRWVVRDIYATSNADTWINVATTTNVWICQEAIKPETGATHLHWTGRQVVDDTEGLQVWSTTLEATVAITGYELTV